MPAADPAASGLLAPALLPTAALALPLNSEEASPQQADAQHQPAANVWHRDARHHHACLFGSLGLLTPALLPAAALALPLSSADAMAQLADAQQWAAAHDALLLGSLGDLLGDSLFALSRQADALVQQQLTGAAQGRVPHPCCTADRAAASAT